MVPSRNLVYFVYMMMASCHWQRTPRPLALARSRTGPDGQFALELERFRLQKNRNYDYLAIFDTFEVTDYFGKM